MKKFRFQVPGSRLLVIRSTGQLALGNPKTGFTLIELLVVISIIGILIALSAVAFQNTKASARDAKRKADLETVRSALEIYRTDCGAYPATLSWGGSLTGSKPSSPCASSDTYLSTVPQDPQAGAGYMYSYTPSGNSYVLCAYLETQSGAVSGCSTCGPRGPVDCHYKAESP